MAAIARRTWDEFETEHIRRAGRTGDSSYTSRAQYFLTSAYTDICTRFHHQDLDKVDSSLVLSTAVRTLALPADCFVVLIFELQQTPGGEYIKTLNQRHLPMMQAHVVAAAAEPVFFSRHADTLYFDRVADQAYKSALYYQSRPVLPDFGVGIESPAIDVVWDEHILELSLVKAGSALWQNDIAQQAGALYNQFVESSPYAMQIRDPNTPNVMLPFGSDEGPTP